MERIRAGHGSGGKLMNDMINGVIKKILGDSTVQIDDAAVLSLSAEKIAFTTDSFVITPLFFPGGNIGHLAVNGTVNDLAVMGAVPKYLSCGLILEEGLEMEELKTVLSSMRQAAEAADVVIVTGDTKVVPHGKGDKIYINTAGIGVFERSPARLPIEVGDKIIVNGTLGDHGAAVMSARNNLSFSAGLQSDCAPLAGLISSVTAAFPNSIKFMRDATRGGAASVLNEITAGNNFGARLKEVGIPVKEEVRGLCDILGLDPLYVANEGKALFVVRALDADDIIAEMRKLPYGENAAVIGEITSEPAGKVCVETEIGGVRMLPLQSEEQLPRIC